MDRLDGILVANRCFSSAFFYTYLDSSDISSESYGKFILMKRRVENIKKN